MYLRKQQNNKGEQDGEEDEEEAAVLNKTSMYSVIDHFRSLELGARSTILEANRRRTTSYYEKARQAHEQSLVLGVPSYSQLIKKRKKEVESLLFYHREGKRSLRTVIVMLDTLTQTVLSEARQKILQPLNYSCDVYHKGVWIPQINIIPNADMHVTVACPWWWHTMREGNHELNKDLSNRFRQALVIDFHHPFCLELERIVLLGGKTLVALWRTVGDRVIVETNEEGGSNNNNNNNTTNGNVVCDRHATTIDPMVRLRRAIVDCFTNDQHEHNFRPLTHHHMKTKKKKRPAAATVSSKHSEKVAAPPLPPLPPLPRKIVRTHTIESKTPGVGSGDGFIHTTLCRLPLECFSTQDVELEPIHRLCREATATYSGHRMLVHRFRFVETTGEGGDSNPCKNPRFDTAMEAPMRVATAKYGSSNNINMNSGVGGGSGGEEGPFALPSSNNNSMNSGITSNAERNHFTTGQVPDMTNPGGIEGLFDPPTTSS